MVDNDLTEAQLRNGYEKCIENVQNLLYSSKLLLTSENTHQYALGLYMYAIEEYGKAEILKSFLAGNKIKYSIPEWIFGRGKYRNKAHSRKLSEGFKKLPPICRKLSRTIEIIHNSSDIAQTFVIEKNGIPIGAISAAPYSTGIFEDAAIPKRTVDFDLKTSCFYIDWNNTKCDWEFVLPTDKDQLTYIIKRMKEAITIRKT